ncbi:SEC-C metal-binding domain-containing protein [Metapseudomonas otitidis]
MANGANRNSLCLCGSGKRFKNYHEYNLRRLIEGLSSV